MKALNCANCGANLNYRADSPVAICQFCDSVNVIESINTPIIQPVNSLSVESPPNFVKELQPRVMFPQKKYTANYYPNFGIVQSGKLWIANTEIFFKPWAIRIDLSMTFMKISDIISMVKTSETLGLRPILTINAKSGQSMKLHIWSRDEIILEIENRKKNLI